MKGNNPKTVELEAMTLGEMNKLLMSSFNKHDKNKIKNKVNNSRPKTSELNLIKIDKKSIIPNVTSKRIKMEAPKSLDQSIINVFDADKTIYSNTKQNKMRKKDLLEQHVYEITGMLLEKKTYKYILKYLKERYNIDVSNSTLTLFLKSKRII